MKKGINVLLMLILLQPFLISHAANKTLLPKPSLGVGYSDDMQMPLGMSCLKINEVKFSGGSKAIISLGRTYSFDEIQKELNVNVSAAASINLFSLGARANYARYIKDTRYSESFYFLEKILLPTQSIITNFGTDALNNFGIAAYKAGPQQFRLSCGNKFHQQVAMGMQFFTTFKLVFASHFDKYKFSSKISTGILDILSAKSSIQEIVTQNHIHGVLEIVALQEGGNPAELANIFEKCDTHYCITTCSFENMNACQGTIDGIINYAKNYLPKQIDYDPKTQQIKGMTSPLSYEYMDYRQIGLTMAPSRLSSEALAARQTLGQIYKTILSQRELIDHILNSQVATEIVKEYKDKLLGLSDALHSNAAVLESDQGAMGCFLDPDQCINIKNNLNQFLKPIDGMTLAKFGLGYIARGPIFNVGIPLGGDRFQWFDERGNNVGEQMMKLSEDGNSIHVEGINKSGARFYGNFAKSGVGTYQGEIRFYGPFALRIPLQLTEVDNPV